MIKARYSKVYATFLCVNRSNSIYRLYFAKIETSLTSLDEVLNSLCVKLDHLYTRTEYALEHRPNKDAASVDDRVTKTELLLLRTSIDDFRQIDRCSRPSAKMSS